MKVPKKVKLELKNACLQNARDLLAEAEDLIERGYYARAVFLAISSYEESLKTSLVGSWLYGFVSDAKFHRTFGRHNPKLLSQYGQLRASQNEKTGKVAIDLVLPTNRDREVEKIMQTRSNSLYVDLKGVKIDVPWSIKSYTASEYIKLARDKLSWELMFEKIEKML